MTSKLFVLFLSSFLVVQNSSAATNKRNDLIFDTVLKPIVDLLTTAINITLSNLLETLDDLVATLLASVADKRGLIPTVASQLNAVLTRVQDALARVTNSNIPLGPCSNTEVIQSTINLVNKITNTAANCLDNTVTAIKLTSDPVIDAINALLNRARTLLGTAISCLNSIFGCGFELLNVVASVTNIIPEIAYLVGTVANGALATLSALSSDIDNCLPQDYVSQCVSDMISLSVCLQSL